MWLALQTPTMSDRERLSRFLRTKLQNAGRQYERAWAEFYAAQSEALKELSTNDDGRVRIVCRRHAERRAVHLDSEGRPRCFEAGHTDCEGCVEDIEDGYIETW